MPRPGSTPSPAFKRGKSLAYGQAGAANDAMEYVPQGEEEEFLFGPTDRPAEPLTAGAPFGQGADVSKYALEDDEQLADRVAEMILAKGGSREAVAWARRRKAGD